MNLKTVSEEGYHKEVSEMLSAYRFEGGEGFWEHYNAGYQALVADLEAFGGCGDSVYEADDFQMYMEKPIEPVMLLSVIIKDRKHWNVAILSKVASTLNDLRGQFAAEIELDMDEDAETASVFISGHNAIGYFESRRTASALDFKYPPPTD